MINIERISDIKSILNFIALEYFLYFRYSIWDFRIDYDIMIFEIYLFF